MSVPVMPSCAFLWLSYILLQHFSPQVPSLVSAGVELWSLLGVTFYLVASLSRYALHCLLNPERDLIKMGFYSHRAITIGLYQTFGIMENWTCSKSIKPFVKILPGQNHDK